MGHIDYNTLVLLMVAVLNCYTAYIVSNTKANMALLEKNTNSIKDALVARTADAAHAAGRDEARIEGEAKAAAVAEGVKQGEK